MRVHKDKSQDYDSFKEKEWNWWRPYGKANESMGRSNAMHLVANGKVTSIGIHLGYKV